MTEIKQIASEVDELNEKGKNISGFYEASSLFAYTTGGEMCASLGLYGTGHYVWGTVFAIGTLLSLCMFSTGRKLAEKKTEELSESVKEACVDSLERKLKGEN